MKEEEKSPSMAETIVEEWTKMYPPGKEEEMFCLKLTSYEIAEMLSDFCEVHPGDITRILLDKGYKLTRSSEGSMKWLIKKEKK